MTKLLTAYLNSPGGRSYRSKGTRRRTCYAAVSAGHHFRKPPRREIRPRLSAVLRRSPAFLSASLRCTPGDILRASSSASTAISFRLRVSLCDSSAEVTIWAWSHLLQSNMLTSRPDGLRTTPARFIVESHFGQCKLHCLVHGRFLVRHNDGLAATATRFNLAALVVVSGFVAARVAEMHIYSFHQWRQARPTAGDCFKN